MVKHHQHNINVSIGRFIRTSVGTENIGNRSKNNTSRDVPLPREVSCMKSSAAPPRREIFRPDLKSQPFTLTLLRTESPKKARTSDGVSKTGSRFILISTRSICVSAQSRQFQSCRNRLDRQEAILYSQWTAILQEVFCGSGLPRTLCQSSSFYVLRHIAYFALGRA